MRPGHAASASLGRRAYPTICRRDLQLEAVYAKRAPFNCRDATRPELLKDRAQSGGFRFTRPVARRHICQTPPCCFVPWRVDGGFKRDTPEHIGCVVLPGECLPSLADGSVPLLMGLQHRLERNQCDMETHSGLEAVAEGRGRACGLLDCEDLRWYIWMGSLREVTNVSVRLTRRGL